MDTPELHPAVPGQTSTGLTVRGDTGRRLISAAEFQQLADVPAAAEWLANVDNPNTRRAYGRDVGEFMSMLGIRRFGELRLVRRAHVIAWRKMLEERGLGPATRRRKLSAVSSLFRYLCNENAVHENPVSGVRRPRMENANEGRTPALSDAQARRLLSAPEGEQPPGPARPGPPGCPALPRAPARRGRAPHGRLAPRAPGRAAPQGPRQGLQDPARPGPPGRALGPRRLPRARHAPPRPATHPCSSRCRPAGPAGRSRATASTSSSGSTPRPTAIPMERIVHALRATAATNALEHEADIARVQDWLGHANVSTTRLYDRSGPPARGQPHVPRQLLRARHRKDAHEANEGEGLESVGSLGSALSVGSLGQERGPEGRGRSRSLPSHFRANGTLRTPRMRPLKLTRSVAPPPSPAKRATGPAEVPDTEVLGSIHSGDRLVQRLCGPRRGRNQPTGSRARDQCRGDRARPGQWTEATGVYPRAHGATKRWACVRAV